MQHEETIEKLEYARARIEEAIDELREPITRGALDAAPWFDYAQSKLGEHEIKGASANPFIVACHQSTTLGKRLASSDETAWCSSFVNKCMVESGVEGTNSARARSWLGWGRELDEPRRGCVVVIRRGNAGHHVALFDKLDGGSVQLLGGNQSDSVKLSSYPVERVLGYRWPDA